MKEWFIPEGKLKSVSVGGVVLWQAKSEKEQLTAPTITISEDGILTMTATDERTETFAIFVNGVEMATVANEEELTPTEGLAYTLSDDGTYYTCTGIGTATDTDIVIADKIDDLPVTNIAANAFFNNKLLTSVYIPKSVTNIGREAFGGCPLLAEIHFNATECDNFGEYVFQKSGIGGEGITLTIGKNVKEVPAYFFSSYTNGYKAKVINVEFEEGSVCESIGKAAFEACTSLTSVEIPDSVTTIGSNAFYYCTSLTSVVIGDSVTTIENKAFYSCKSLKSVNIPDSVTNIGDRVFCKCISLVDITVSENNVQYQSIDGVVYTKDSRKLVQYAAGKKCLSFVIPDSVTSIGSGAFEGCIMLASVEIPESVTSIDSYAFSNCNRLVEVYNKTSLKITAGTSDYGSVGSHAIAIYTEPYASKLSMDEDEYILYTDGGEISLVGYVGVETDLVLPNGITKINKQALAELDVDGYPCVINPLANVVIPDSVTSIDDYAFSCCRSLKSVNIPDSVTNIGMGAFERCISLTNVNIPDSVTNIGGEAFGYCKSITSVAIPSSIKVIESQTFYYCDKMESVVIPVSVTKIINYAFDFCKSLSSVYYEGNAAQWAKITISSTGNSYLKNRSRYYYSEEAPAIAGDWWHYVNGVPTVW